jgi:deoxyribonuclease I
MLGTYLGRLAFVTAAFIATTGCAATASETTQSSESSISEQTRVVSYESVENLHDTELKNGLFALIKDHRPLGYDRARKQIFTNPTFYGPDGMIECQYSGRKVQPDGTLSPSDFNTEHTWPQSMGARVEPAKSDLHHLFPVDGQTNSARGNHPFGDATCLENLAACPFENGGSALGDNAAGDRVFQVRKERRGNVARAMFYFSIRYNKRISLDQETTLKHWHVEDPVDAEENRRNDAIEAVQNNRNPFIDRPEFVERIADF